MKFKKIQSENKSDKVVSVIMNLIESGQLQPGDKLPPENEFAENLGVSRGILREALTILQYQGFISRKPKDGTYVRKISKEQVTAESMIESLKNATYLDLIELREALEQKSVELAIMRADDEEILDIKRTLEKTNPLDENYSVTDYNFHLKIAEMSKNNLLINFIDNYYELIHEMGEKSNTNVTRREEIIEEHKNLINAIYKRDIELAKKSLNYHLSQVKDNVVGKKNQEDL
ncbi:FadR/GntR family transcriptional regulator [Proteiniclasticum ruminis]|uniref:GntR family transcriptional regulator, transcriptional repressor for pyruvate dehydrogenase complex n=1 Tax=Proteiniclasticum ruminis TaxID=398199 RepID=A0A1G8HCC9_9CLOT|nr:FadR/GntR family transcriptional regulator [Proteiniclasticum ruminis]SDI04150.1 GntR family transcriptional regulator, transcriptional repressor for pyruvate dehydrogenase complex [Proteiniclasticum ruminis]